MPFVAEKKNATTRDVFLRFNDVCETHFTDIIQSGEEIGQYLQNYMSDEA